MSFGGLDRSYRLYIPAGLPSPAPLVVMMHGGFGSGQQAERAYGWDELADSAKFVVAYPDGVGRAWNVGGCCGRPGRENIDDVGFINAVVDDIAANVDHRPEAACTRPVSATAACWPTRWRATPAPSPRSVPTRPPNSTSAPRRTRRR